MKRRGQKKNIWVVLLSGVIALAMVITSGVSGGSPGLLSRIVRGFFSPAGKAVTVICRKAEELGDHMDQVEKFRDENTELRSQVARLELEVQKAEQTEKENAELRSMLKLSRQHTTFTFIPADMTGGPSSNFSSDFTINAGSGDGVDVGMCVVSIEGDVVGSVTQVGPSWAEVTTILDPSSQLSACVKGSDYVSVAGGDYSLMSSGRLALKYMPSDCELHIGDEIITTGSGGVYPGGLRIGQVEKVTDDPSGLAETAVLKPFARPDSLSRVFVISYTDSGK